MTTIIWDGKQMIADTLMSWGGTKLKGVKAFQHQDVLIGISGDYVSGAAFVLWVKSGMALDAWPSEIKKENCVALVVHKSGLVQRFEGSPYPTPVLEAYTAIGSGTDFVLGAMAHGATALEAMEIAKKLDVGTGGELTVLHF